jgi:hypothetical protein
MKRTVIDLIDEESDIQRKLPKTQQSVAAGFDSVAGVYHTKTQIPYYKVGNIISISRSSIPTSEIDSSTYDSQLMRRYQADLKFRPTTAKYIFEHYDYEMINEELLVKRFKALCDKYTEYNLHLQSIYSELDYAYIEGYGCSWTNQLSVENKLFRMPEESLILHQGILEYDTTGELRAEAMKMFPADCEFKAMENLFPTHTWGGE